ncbi:hypothetical protein TON_1826 [Thermococcus onnurineus NA1]|uniref:Uncharacterized protein n=1 Tax=Thermococcus onnurineus (strain NA1) TaxID=523850 RepID=B6YVJ2_THEON|nr:hypothetical protein [Thermococcus onnurineus]ACJ17316.1 hypothetical protein TON_1826 [Thermococcus onnurineus NA1]
MQTQVAVLTLLLVISTISAYLIMDGKANFRLKLLAIILFSGVVIFYIRIGFGRYFTTIDESYYVSLLGDSLWYKTSIVSGYITPFSLHLVYSFSSDVIGIVVRYSIVVAVLYILILFFAYQRNGVSKNHALLAILLLFITPLYWWSVIQIRPQQIGVLVGLILAVLIVTGRPTFRFFVGVLILYVALIFAHVLSFILYSAVFVMYLALLILWENKPRENAKKYLTVAVSIIVSWIVFVTFPYSSNLFKNMTWIANNVLNLQMSVQTFYVASTFVMGMFLAIVYLMAKYFSSHNPINLDSLKVPLLKLVDAEVNVFRRYLLWIVVGVAVLVVFYVQFELGAQIYTRVYNNSTAAVVFFQMGNLFFALFFLRGFFMKIRENTMTDFDILSVLWIPIGVALLIISFFMPKGSSIWGFHNWLVRTLQYFVVFASPIVAYSIMGDITPKNSVRMRSVLSLLLGILIIISVLNTIRIPGIYNYDTIWTPELVNVCQESPVSAIYTPRVERSVYYTFAMNNLLKVCGGYLKDPNIKSPTYLILSSDQLYVYIPDYRPIGLGAFENSLQDVGGIAWIIAGGNRDEVGEYALSLLGNAVPVPVEKDGDSCPLSPDRIGYPTVLVGGKAVNPCTLRLVEEHVVPVYLDSYSVRTPTGMYSVSHADAWWNVEDGLFVIQAVEYYNTPVLIIEGTNVDATLAAVYYFVEEVYPNLFLKYQNTKYIVGKWEEDDDTVIDVAKLTSQDTNGFSPGDKITILETG